MTVIHSQRIFTRMADPNTDQREWLNGLLRRFGLTATELARRAELNPSTLTRFLQPGGREGHELSARTIRKIEESLNLARDAAGPVLLSGFSESEARQLTSMEGVPPDIRAAAAALKAGRNGVDVWEIRSSGLEAIRLYAGDLVIVDLNAQVMPRDRVCAQVYDHARGTARTVFRLWEPPYLLAGSTERPDVVDGRNVVIAGVVIAALSPRNLLHVAPAA
jgi:hypothetical protein